MAGFFYLGGRDESSRKQVEREEQQQGLFLYKNEEIYSNNNNNNNNKGFEIWPEYYLQHHHHQQAVNGEYSTFGAGPSRRNLSFSDELTSRSAGFTVMRSQGLGGIGGGGGINCQDCGNQAKKDCVHLRCRTCCKSRGFECPTHIKSTWVPAAKRRERQQQLEALQRQQQQQEEQKQQTQLRVENTKRHRDDDEDGGGGHDQQGLDMVQFPSEVNSPALFRCVKVSGIDDAEEAYAYQTAVNIGGHVFKGILYDQGPNGGEESSPGGVGHSTQQLDLIMAAETNNNSGAVAVNTTSSNDEAAVLDPSLYPAPLNAFMTGTQFFPCSRP